MIHCQANVAVAQYFHRHAWSNTSADEIGGKRMSERMEIGSTAFIFVFYSGAF